MHVQIQKIFVARTIYHHSQRTNEHATLLVYVDSNDAYEMFDDRENDHYSLAGTEEFILKEWRERNQKLIEDGFQRDNLSGEPKWQAFI